MPSWVIEIINSIANDSSAWLWMLSLLIVGSAVEEVPVPGDISQHIPQTEGRKKERNSKHPANVSQPLWKTSRFFPSGGKTVLLNFPAAKWLRLIWETGWGQTELDMRSSEFTISVKYFIPKGLSDTPNTHFRCRGSVAMPWGSVSGVCLFGSTTGLHCTVGKVSHGRPHLHLPACLAHWLGCVTSVCLLRNVLTQKVMQL